MRSIAKQLLAAVHQAVNDDGKLGFLILGVVTAAVATAAFLLKRR